MKRKPPPQRPTLGTPLPRARESDPVGTVGSYILDQLRAGVDPHNAALAAGVTIAEYAAWIREADLVQQALEAGADWDTDFSPEEQDVALWAAEARRAHGRHVAALIVIAEQMARGDMPGKRWTRTRTDGEGNTVEQVVTEEVLAPDGDMLKFKLSALAPDVYGKASRVDLTVHDVTDSEGVASLVETRFEAAAAAVEAAAADHDGDGDDG